MPARNRRSPVLLLHVGWAREYDGDPADPPQGKFGFIARGRGDPNEAVNFRTFRGRCYGYAPQGSLDLARLGASPAADRLDHALVVFTATNPDGSGRYVVGWYRDATLHAELQETRPDPRRPYFIVETAAANAHLVPVDARTFRIPAMRAGWPGVANAFYASDVLSSKRLDRIAAYVAGAASSGFQEGAPKPRAGGGAPRQPDPELRAKVERGAVNAVRAHYRALGYKVKLVEKENLGWDLEARSGARELLVEVKGRSGTGAVELTPNEWKAMNGRETRTRYRLAVVHDALNPSCRPAIFSYRPGDRNWVSEEGRTLAIRTVTGAVVSF